MAGRKEHLFKCSDVQSRGYVHFLEDLNNKRKFCDVTFEIGGESISAHRIIITAVIPYFKRVLFNEDRNLEEINIPNIEPSALKYIIDFAYTCELKINAENVRELLAAACFLGVNEVRKECCDFIADSLESEDIMSIRELATDLNCPELLKSTRSYAVENFVEVSQTKDFLNYSSNFLKELLSQDDLNVDDEKNVFEALMRWTKASPEDRKNEFPDLLRNVRLPLLKPLYLAAVVENEEFIRSSLLCRDLVDEAKNYILCSELRKHSCSFSTSLREPLNYLSDEDIKTDCIVKLYFGEAHVAQRFDITKGKWITMERKSFLINAGSTVELQNKIYFIRWGYTTEYDPVTNVYKCLVSMPTPRALSGSCAFKDVIYICGGRSNDKSLNTVEYFDPKKNKWTSAKNMNTCRQGPSAVRLGKCIIVLGGSDGTSCFDSVEKYNPLKKRWTMMPPMMFKRYLAGAASLNGKLYVCGGFTSSNLITESAEVYDPIKKSWQLISPMNSARRELRLLSCGGKLYVFGGQNLEGKHADHIFDIYEPKSGEWTAGPSTDPRYNTSGAVAMLSANLKT